VLLVTHNVVYSEKLKNKVKMS